MRELSDLGPAPPDIATCPRCGTGRLVRRQQLFADPEPHDLGLAFYLRYRRACRRSTCAILRRTYLCELCGHQWRVDEIVTQIADQASGIG